MLVGDSGSGRQLITGVSASFGRIEIELYGMRTECPRKVHWLKVIDPELAVASGCFAAM